MIRRRIASAVAAVAIAGSTVLVAAGPAAAHKSTPTPTGTTSLFAVLDADGDTFDRNWNDFDIVDRAVRTVLGAKPDSAVGLLADGTVALTAFVPTDRAFKKLAADLTGRWYHSESKVFGAIAGAVDVDTLEQVLLYHVVPGATIDYHTALGADGAELAMAQGGTVTVDVKHSWYGKRIMLVDADPDDRNPTVLRSARDINAGNAQIAHGISRVLRPVDL